MLQGTIGFVGTGVMAEVMLAALLDEGVPADRVIASHRRADRRAELEARYGVRTCADNAEAAAADLVVLGVKPQNLATVCAELRGRLAADATVLSIAAGAPVLYLQTALDHRRVVRAMPNLPCRIRKGMTVWIAAPGLAASEIAQVGWVLRAIGDDQRVDDEEHLDRATAVSGTGPAIVAHFVKAFLEAANYVGEPRELGYRSVLATVAGTVELLRHSDRHVAELIDEVASPGGTTSRALQVLKDGRFSAVLTESVDAAYRRTKEIRPKPPHSG